MSVGELLKDGKYLDAMESALYARLLDKLDADCYDECFKIVNLLDRLKII